MLQQNGVHLDVMCALSTCDPLSSCHITQEKVAGSFKEGRVHEDVWALQLKPTLASAAAAGGRYSALILAVLRVLCCVVWPDCLFSTPALFLFKLVSSADSRFVGAVL